MIEDLTAYTLESLPEIPGGWTERQYTVKGQQLRLMMPAVPDALLDVPEVLARHEADGYMPYWGYLWPTSLDMVAAILTAPASEPQSVLEIGAGLGLAGLGALSAGHQVLFTDYDQVSVRVALLNAHLNGFTDVRGAALDWRTPPDQRFSWIIGCDVIYERVTHPLVLDVMQAMLADGGEGWLADPGRHTADEFVALARARGFTVECRKIEREPFPTRPAGTTDIYVLRKSPVSTPPVSQSGDSRHV